VLQPQAITAFKAHWKVSSPPFQKISNLPFNIEELAEKIATKVAKKISSLPSSSQSKSSATLLNPSSSTSLKAGNLVELLQEVADFGLVKVENSCVIKCCSCEVKQMEAWQPVYFCQTKCINNSRLASVRNGIARNKHSIDIFLPTPTTTLYII
jgi:hypothetical protein